MVSVQFGQALGKSLFDSASPAGVVTLRLTFAAIVLPVAYRPRLPLDWSTRIAVLAFGMAIAGMNIVYFALAYVPVAVAMTLQLLGPLALALAGSRRALDFVFASLAVVGLLLFFIPGTTESSLSWVPGGPGA